MRTWNSTLSGQGFSADTVNAVWLKGKAVPGYDSTMHRRDACGAWMKRDQYGQQSSQGWEIDHIVPVSKKGTDDLSNLQPLHWKNNRHKADQHPQWTCLITR